VSEAVDPDTLRTQMLERWEHAAVGWGKRAEDVRNHGMPVSLWMIEHLALQPGQRVLELAAGPGDTGLMAAELVTPGGTLISSDGAEAMLYLARGRAEKLGIHNVEFKQFELEWIDLPTASVDAVLCRWGIMLSVDPGAAAREMRRVLRPGGHVAVAVWAPSDENPWATVPHGVLIERGLMEPPDPTQPGMFTLAAPGALSEVLEDAGFVDVVVEEIVLERQYSDPDEFIAETHDLSGMFSRALAGASEEQRTAVRESIAERLKPFTSADGTISLPGKSLGAAASA
jgi:SAM-dependent methyltransferase